MVVELTQHEAAMIFAVADLEARACFLFAARMESLPVMASGMREEAYRFARIRDKMRDALPDLKDAVNEGRP